MVPIIKSQFTIRVIDESLARIVKCLDLLTIEEIWYRHNDHTNAIGNIVLHLSGNVRQYIVSGLGGEKDIRVREEEFSTNRNESKDKLKTLIQETLIASDNVIQNMDGDTLHEEITIQGFEHTKLSAIIHVIEHLSYHVGQITFYTKYLKNVDTAYYGDLDLNITG